MTLPRGRICRLDLPLLRLSHQHAAAYFSLAATRHSLQSCRIKYKRRATAFEVKWHRPPQTTACSTLPGKGFGALPIHCKQAVLTAPCGWHNNEESYPDLTLRLPDGTTILAHKSVLCTSNEHFQRLCAPATPRGVSTFARHTFC